MSELAGKNIAIDEDTSASSDEARLIGNDLQPPYPASEQRAQRLAATMADVAVTPASAGCCGFAGDRGWLVPELTASATQLEASEIRASGAAEIYSSSRTCEIGLTRATGILARSFIHLLERATRK